ncbi:predicted protein [Cyanophage PSS2]|uniref:hypothetical protein n=1 Tax=Cyanophage PSS2 TaxID=658401 RepID=UPI0001B0400E|nr:hypothetical protein PSS2_gp056 [Cyanophage PSS2]ACT65618.1 hypothetical protein [Cyanophage PSS2]ACY75760.1 predicted protein [Cyanophage PSS2]
MKKKKKITKDPLKQGLYRVGQRRLKSKEWNWRNEYWAFIALIASIVFIQYMHVYSHAHCNAWSEWSQRDK